jgi:hypothetical protein
MTVPGSCQPGAFRGHRSRNRSLFHRMLRRSQFSALLALFALLFGNVAGWLHVGCAEICEHASQKPAGCATPVAPAADTAHCCGGHAAETNRAAGRHEKSPAVPRNSHDSDHCTVCQTFFSQRAISALFAPVGCWQPLSPEPACGSVEPCDLPVALAASISVRGPPRA